MAFLIRFDPDAGRNLKEGFLAPDGDIVPYAWLAEDFDTLPAAIRVTSRISRRQGIDWWVNGRVVRAENHDTDTPDLAEVRRDIGEIMGLRRWNHAEAERVRDLADQLEFIPGARLGGRADDGRDRRTMQAVRSVLAEWDRIASAPLELPT